MININFTGDVSFTGTYKENLEKNSPILSEAVSNYIKTADYTVVNLEGPATVEWCLREDIQVVSPPRCLVYLANHHITHINIANNHIFDCGLNGYTETISKASEVNVSVVGQCDEDGYSIEIVEKGNVKVGLIGISQVFNNMSVECTERIATYNKERLKKAIESIRNKVDWIVLNYHGGEEYTVYPWQKRRMLLKSFFTLPVDIIVCHHSHTVQPYEKIAKNKYIFYSLGNFIFDLTNHRNKSYLNDSLILNLKFTENEVKISFLPVQLLPQSGYVDKGGNAEKLFFDIAKIGYSVRSWDKECSRVVKERNTNSSVENQGSIKNKLTGLIKKVFTIIRNDEFRAIVIGHIKNKLIN